MAFTDFCISDGMAFCLNANAFFFLLLISVSDCQNKLRHGNMALLRFDHKETAATKFRNWTAYI